MTYICLWPIKSRLIMTDSVNWFSVSWYRGGVGGYCIYRRYLNTTLFSTKVISVFIALVHTVLILAKEAKTLFYIIAVDFSCYFFALYTIYETYIQKVDISWSCDNIFFLFLNFFLLLLLLILFLFVLKFIYLFWWK